MLTNTKHSLNAKVSPIDAMSVRWTGGLWKERFDTCADATVPQLQKMFEDKDISHVLENFRICAGETDGNFDGTVFGDGDFYKWMESALYVAVRKNDKDLLKQIDYYIDLIGKAQLDDGYISTKQIIGERNQNGITRMGDINDFEVYNFGHLFTSACLHKRLTGKDSFLEIAKKTADYLEKMYAEAIRTKEVQTAVCPSHYMGLIEMYRTTGEKRYLDLANLAISLRDNVKNGLDDNQDRIPLKEHDKIIGHAVRANYLYAGVADLCLEVDEPELREVLEKVWRSLVDKKIYITGGCGALYNGVSPYGNFFIDQKVHQAYGYEYQLPNITAYNETCASLGAVFWAYRMFQLEPKAEYFDMIERMMLNVNLAALSMDGKKFFYENMLRRARKLDYELVWPLTRSEYILSYCCPPNLARTIAQSSEYAYTVSEDSVWMGMYGANEAKISLDNDAKFTIVQDTKYPFDGMISISFKDVEINKPFYLKLRIPGWACCGYIQTTKGKIALSEENSDSYVSVLIEDICKEHVEIYFEMKVRYTLANTMVEETTGQVAIERGPLVYCCESVDTDIETLDDVYVDIHSQVTYSEIEINGRKVQALEMEERVIDRTRFNRNVLYQSMNDTKTYPKRIRFIPYYAWDNREYGEMRIWFPVLLNSSTETLRQTNLDKKIIVLDDDPTGIQTVHGVSVYTDWEKNSIRQGFEEENTVFYILTNSRSLSAKESEEIHREIAKRICQVSRELKKDFILISRGDSTLRGHYPLETEVLKETIESEKHVLVDGEIFCPFFLEGGRITIDNVHYVKEQNMLIPAGMTEFAKDKTFGYCSSDLTEFIEEKTNGKYKKQDCIVISLEELRENKISDIKQKLLSAKNFQKIIVNVTNYDEMKVFCEVFKQVVECGKTFIVRSAAGFPKVLGGIHDRELLKKNELVRDSNLGGIVIVGSHVKKTTLQLEELKKIENNVRFIEFDVKTCIEEDKLKEEEVQRVSKETETTIREGNTVVVYTSREVFTSDTNDKEKNLKLSVKVSEAITKVITNLKVQPKFIVAKGGITSSDIGTKGLGVQKAFVLGQIKKGIPVWLTGKESKFPGMPYIIFPGNVGEVSTLREIVDELI